MVWACRPAHTGRGSGAAIESPAITLSSGPIGLSCRKIRASASTNAAAERWEDGHPPGLAGGPRSQGHPPVVLDTRGPDRRPPGGPGLAGLGEDQAGAFVGVVRVVRHVGRPGAASANSAYVRDAAPLSRARGPGAGRAGDGVAGEVQEGAGEARRDRPQEAHPRLASRSAVDTGASSRSPVHTGDLSTGGATAAESGIRLLSGALGPASLWPSCARPAPSAPSRVAGPGRSPLRPGSGRGLASRRSSGRPATRSAAPPGRRHT